MADVVAITRDAKFVATPTPLREALSRHWIDLAILAGWAALALLLALAATRRLGKASA